MMSRGRVSLNLNNVLEPGTMSWYEEGDYVRIMQHQPHREVMLTKASRSIWQLVTNNNLAVEEIIEKLQHSYSKELIIANLETMVNMQLVRTKENFLWQEE